MDKKFVNYLFVLFIAWTGYTFGLIFGIKFAMWVL